VQLRVIWNQPDKKTAGDVLDDWIRQASESKVRQLMVMANTMKAFRRGILAWYDYRISTAMIEGINNKIKVMKRNAYGFRDDKYFALRLYALHDCRITRNVG
jgi:transposase